MVKRKLNMKDMKNLNIKVLLILISGFLFFGCEDQGEGVFDTGELTANLSAPSTGAYLRGETSEFTMELSVSENPGVSVDEIIIYGQLNATVDDELTSSEVVELSRQSSEGEFVISASEVFSSLPVNGVVLSEDDLAPGDQFIFTYELVLSDGRVLTPAATYAVTFTCPSDIAGTYSFVSTGFFGDGAGGQTSPYGEFTGEVVLTEDASGIYTVDDMSFGLYDQGYGDTSPSGQIEEVCGSISDRGSTDQYGDPFTINGSLNDDGSIELTWGNTWGDTGTVVLTPQ